MYNLIEYNDNYYQEVCTNSIEMNQLWLMLVLLIFFPGNSVLFKFKQKIIGSTVNDGTKIFEIMVPLRYLNNFWRTIGKPFINCENSLNWSANCVISNSAANQATTIAITDIKLYVPLLTLSTQDNANLLRQLKPEFKLTIN